MIDLRKEYILKIEKINEDKIIITLDNNDLKSKNIDATSFLHNSPETQDLFWDVMQEAEKQYGFNIDESMIRVDAHISNSGLYTLIVTKSSNKLDFLPLKNIDNNKSKNIKLKRKDVSNSYGNQIYSFENFSDLANYAKVSEIKANSSLYVLNNKFYLQTSEKDSTISDYASLVINPEIMMSKIHEYGKSIYKNNAIESLLKALS